MRFSNFLEPLCLPVSYGPLGTELGTAVPNLDAIRRTLVQFSTMSQMFEPIGSLVRSFLLN